MPLEMNKNYTRSETTFHHEASNAVGKPTATSTTSQYPPTSQQPIITHPISQQRLISSNTSCVPQKNGQCYNNYQGARKKNAGENSKRKSTLSFDSSVQAVAQR